MRHYFFFLLAILFVASCSPRVTSDMAQTPPYSAPASAPTTVPTLADTTLLWKISTPGASASSYLFGTIHIIPEEKYFLPERVLNALNAADEVVFEINPNDLKDPMQMMGILGKLNMRGDTTLADLLDAEQYAVVESYFADQGIPFFLFKRMKPLFLSSMVGQDMPDMSGGMPGGGAPGAQSGMKSYELELSDLANKNKQKIGGLETMEFQLSLFDSIPYEPQAKMLYEAVVADKVAEETGGSNELDQMVEIYRRQAVAEMAKLMKEESAGVSRFEELLLTKRNINWVPVIRDALGDKSTFYAVGAGHLGGENGVISLLRQQGLTVEPVF